MEDANPEPDEQEENGEGKEDPDHLAHRSEADGDTSNAEDEADKEHGEEQQQQIRENAHHFAAKHTNK